MSFKFRVEDIRFMEKRS